jgi:hypothetical protein
VDHAHTATDITDNRAVDAQNMIGNVFGSASKRNGSERYISQAISTQPITGLYRASLDQGTTTKKVLLMTTWDRIYASTSDIAPVWKLLKRGLVTHNQHFSFANSAGKIVMTGDALTDPVFVYDVVRDSFTGLFDVGTSSFQSKLRAKYVLATNGYLVLGNVMDVKDELSGSTTYYGSQIRYSLFQQISSFTVARFINIKTDDGESITGMTEKGGEVGNSIVVYKPSSVSSILYTVLNLNESGGDITVSNVASGFGCISPRGLVNIGEFDVVPTRDGIILYDGGRKTRLNLLDESRPISTLIKLDYERTLKYSTYDRSLIGWYPKKQLLLYSFIDPYYSPSDKPNRIFVYDIQTGEWWPFKNWLADSFTTFDGNGDDGTLLYGDSSDGYVYKADLRTRNDDARKELSLFTMDSNVGWSSGTVDSVNLVEGSGSLKIYNTFANQFHSSMTKMSLIQFGEWNDKSPVFIDKDYLSFKLKLSSYAVLSTVTIGFQYEATITSFTNYQSLVTLSSDTLVTLAGSTGALSSFAEINVALSSFVLPSTWYDPAIQDAPFSRALTVYGIRFDFTGISSNTINVDDVRIVQGTDNIIESFYLSKNFNLGAVNDKDFRQIILSRDKSADSSFNVDIFTDYGYYANKKTIKSDIQKEIFILGFKGTNGITRLRSSDFSVMDSTQFPNPNILDYMNGTASKDYLFVFDKVANEVLVLDRSDLSIIVSRFGGLGNGATTFNTVNQMALSGDKLYLCDNFNDRIQKLVFQSGELLYSDTYGELGLGTTNFFSPSGVTADKTHVWVADDGNFRLMKFTISTFGYVSEKRIETNTIGESTLQNDGDFLYLAYNKISNTPYYQDVILERRTKGDMTLVNRTVIKPQDIVDYSTYTLAGDIALFGKYIYISFTKNLVGGTGTYYVQKRLKDGFDLVDEFSTSGVQFSVIGDGKAYDPITKSEKINLEAISGVYVQLKYYDNSIDNTFTLHNYSFALDPKSYTETP